MLFVRNHDKIGVASRVGKRPAKKKRQIGTLPGPLGTPTGLTELRVHPNKGKRFLRQFGLIILLVLGELGDSEV